MVPHLFFYQLTLIALVWLCLMLQWVWPSDCATASPTPPQPTPPRRQHSREPKPFAGLTRKPHCDACAHAPPLARTPPQLRATTHRAYARPPAPGGHVVALLPPSALCLSGSGGAGQYQCQWASQRWTLAPAVLHGLWVVFQKWRWPFLHCPFKGIAVD